MARKGESKGEKKPDNRRHKIPMGGHGSSKVSVRKVAAVARAEEMLAMRIRGATINQIAKHMGLNPGTIHKALVAQASMHATTLEDPRQLVFQMMVEQLDALTRTWYPRAHGYADADGNRIDPDIDAANFLLGIIDRRAKLYGLNAPVKLEIDVRVTVTQLAEAQTGAFPLVIERLEREGWTPEQLERAAYAIQLMQEQAGERLKALDAAPVEAEFEEVNGDG